MKKIKPVAYKATLQTVARYHKQQKAGKIIQSTTIEKYEKSIKCYLTKSGQLKKDLTQRQIQNFNRKVEAFKKDKYASVESIKESTKRSANTFVEALAKKGFNIIVEDGRIFVLIGGVGYEKD